MLPQSFYRPASQPTLDLVVSLTTSPNRLPTLNLDTFKHCRVLLNLPRLFRNTDAYSTEDIDLIQSKYPNLVINWLPTDLGPQCKLLGALHVTKPCQYILVIDDDIAYSSTIIDAYESAINESLGQRLVYCAKPEVIGGLHVCPGFSSFCVKRDLLPPYFEGLVALNEKASQYCKRHDDMLFAAAFLDLGLDVRKVHMLGPLALPSGFDDTALHIEGPSAIKHIRCTSALWAQRLQCPCF